MKIDLNFQFSSDVAEEVFNCTKRNITWITGYGGGKSYTACQKALALMCKFPGYRVAIGRYSATELRRTTMQTFYKVCPAALYEPAYGGHRVDSLGYLDLINKSRVYWMHFDEFDESALRSLEINMAIIDQAEEVPEQVYLTLDSRVGRWDDVEVPEDIAPYLQTNAFTGAKMAPAYMLCLANPPDEGEFSYLYTRFHPDFAPEELRHTHAFYQSDSRVNKALPPEVIQTYLTRDEEWVDKYVRGNIQRSVGAIHEVSPDSILDVDETWIKKNLIGKSSLSRVLDHGASSPTSCLWFASCGDIYVCYREYYVPDQVISKHRSAIAALSHGEEYVYDLADPSIFKKTQEKFGGFWSVADEYSDPLIDAPQLCWLPADNNELATRNRINELLRSDPSVQHPISKKLGAPRLYFIKQSPANPNGCYHSIRETKSQRKKLLAEINGKKIFSDDRDPKITDHAYDCVRYYCSSHSSGLRDAVPPPGRNTFKAAINRIKAVRMKNAISSRL